jgi:hypothetical protein
VTKVRALRDGRTIGGISFTRGPLAHLLRNRFYIGEVVYREEICPGEHPPIIDRDLFDAVQRKLADQRNDHHSMRQKSEALLIGRIFDDRGNRMTPSHARKAGVRYRYYVSAALTQGQPELAGSVSRVSAVEIEQLVCDAVLKHLAEPSAGPAGDLVREHVARIEVGDGQVAITLHIAGRPEEAEPENGITPTVLSVPWRKTLNRPHREIIIPAAAGPAAVRPIRADTRAKLVASIARGRSWLSQIQAGAVASVDEIAAREQCSKRHVNMTISLAFLAPDLVKAAVDGRLPHGIGVARLFDPPADWHRQRRSLGLLPSVSVSLSGAQTADRD